MSFRVTTPRALVDYARSKRQTRQSDESDGGERPAPLPGIIGATGHRVTWEFQSERIARHAVEMCDNALLDTNLHEAKRNAIEVTRKQIADALELWMDTDDGL